MGPLLAPERRIYTVTELNREIRGLLEASFPLIWLEGEISNLSRPASGHWYFSLKDSGAQVRCALFRNRARLLKVPLSNGQQILVRARIGLYEPRGDYQLIIEHLEDAGEGALRRAFEALKLRLEQAGLFAMERKQTLPPFPARLGLITSPSGAAIRDVLSVLQRRYPALPILVYPVSVQGSDAASQIARAIELASARRDCDVLLLVRGGGSLEDLWPFNEEIVAHAIADCKIPIVAGVGHETDVTIADFAADVRAPTPSAAAELVSPDQQQWLDRLQQQDTRLVNAFCRYLEQRRQHINGLAQQLRRQHPGHRLEDQAQRLDDIALRLRQSMRLRLDREHSWLQGISTRLRAQSPQLQILQLKTHQVELYRRLLSAIQLTLERRRQSLDSVGRTLHSLSPLQTLERGYAILRDPLKGQIIRQGKNLQAGVEIEAWLSDSRLLCRVVDILPAPDK